MIVLEKHRSVEKSIGLDRRGGKCQSVLVQLIHLITLFALNTMELIFIILHISSDLDQAVLAVIPVGGAFPIMVSHMHLLYNRKQYYSLFDELQDMVNKSGLKSNYSHGYKFNFWFQFLQNIFRNEATRKPDNLLSCWTTRHIRNDNHFLWPKHYGNHIVIIILSGGVPLVNRQIWNRFVVFLVSSLASTNRYSSQQNPRSNYFGHQTTGSRLIWIRRYAVRRWPHSKPFQ